MHGWSTTPPSVAVRQNVAPWIGALSTPVSITMFTDRCMKRELQSLIGTLTTACQPGGAAREVVPQQDDRSCKDPKALLSFCTAQYGCLSISPVVACHCRLLEWSGCDPAMVTPRIEVTSDASGHWGCGAWSQGSWFQYEWLKGSSHHHISFKER